MFEQVLSEYGHIDYLINNAGIQIAADTDKLRVQDFDKVLAVNLRGAFLCAQAAIRQFLAAGTGGAIVNVSSVHQVIPKPRFVGYSVSKGGMQNLTHTLALEYAARGIRVNGLGPAQPSRRSTGHGSTTRSSAPLWRATSRCAVPVTPRRWPRSPRPSARTRPPTSPGRPCSWTGA
jgi:NAD(P)-dependent dehydrogenase (short-subunit alcohol dehydrogenase family)